MIVQILRLRINSKLEFNFGFTILSEPQKLIANKTHLQNKMRGKFSLFLPSSFVSGWNVEYDFKNVFLGNSHVFKKC